MERENKTEIVKLRVAPETVEKLDRLAIATNGNRSEIIRQLIEQAITGQQPQSAARANWPAEMIRK